jgi:hypothetical protein
MLKNKVRQVDTRHILIRDVIYNVCSGCLLILQPVTQPLKYRNLLSIVTIIVIVITVHQTSTSTWLSSREKAISNLGKPTIDLHQSACQNDRHHA